MPAPLANQNENDRATLKRNRFSSDRLPTQFLPVPDFSNQLPGSDLIPEQTFAGHAPRESAV
jgi:hypothetical protein